MNIDEFEFYYYLAPNPEKAKLNILFAHANGIPSLTYQRFLKKMSEDLNYNIVTYDMRGIGKTKAKENINKNIWSWQTLIDDHIAIYKELRRKISGVWILGGHSLGAWLSLLSTEKLNLSSALLLDPPILSPTNTFKWAFAHFIQKKHLNPLSQKVKKRKRKYPSYEAAFEQIKKSSLMKTWDKEDIYNYLEGSFASQDDHIKLRHNPNWEGHLFEEYPPTAFIGFLKLSRKFRRDFRPIFVVGENSDTCNPKAKNWIKLFFPKLKWIIIQNGSHMFPIENTEQTIKEIGKVI
jgi:pimeloyl-ACP methyl ester carboxylesterase